ncbi:MAG: HD domain-containing protein, partial [Candidatus Latescibacteria bacterium]|nr:HD domain-containing protein [Candidatus Latescibacterota bacterium]
MVETIAAHDSTIRDDPEALFQELLEDFQRSASPEAIERLRDAYAYSKERHDTGFRLSGHPYIHHCVEVARTLYALHMDIDTLIAGLLHDVIEDTETKIEEIADRFGPAVAIIVEGMTKISTLKLHSREIQQAENFRKMLMSMAQDIRVILVKFADRLHNMRTLKFLPESKQEKI